MPWAPFDAGSSIGTTGSENGTIVRDLEHDQGARITLEQGCDHAPFSITCSIYGWFFHTRFMSSQTEAETECDAMAAALAAIVARIPLESDPEVESRMRAVSDAITAFLDAFP